MSEPNYKIADDFKATVKLFSGREVVLDMMKISTAEWKQAIKTGTSDEEEYAILSKASGLSVEELGTMSQPDYRLLIEAFIRLGTQPLANPT